MNESQEKLITSTSTPLLEHLIELRSRLLKIVLFVCLLFFGLCYFSNDLYSIIAKPLMALLPASTSMIATEVTSTFSAPLKLTFVVSVFLAIPFILYQIWSFIAPGLYRNEKYFAIPLLLSSVILFYCGIVFAYFVILPLTFKFFITAGPQGVTVMTDINKYLDFVLVFFFAFGISFEIPVITLLLIKAGLVSKKQLHDMRSYIIVGCFVLAMFVSPPDVLSQTLLAVPMWLLFELGLLLAYLIPSKSQL